MPCNRDCGNEPTSNPTSLHPTTLPTSGPTSDPTEVPTRAPNAISTTETEVIHDGAVRDTTTNVPISEDQMPKDSQSDSSVIDLMSDSLLILALCSMILFLLCCILFIAICTVKRKQKEKSDYFPPSQSMEMNRIVSASMTEIAVCEESPNINTSDAFVTPSPNFLSLSTADSIPNDTSNMNFNEKESSDDDGDDDCGEIYMKGDEYVTKEHSDELNGDVVIGSLEEGMNDTTAGNEQDEQECDDLYKKPIEETTDGNTKC